MKWFLIACLATFSSCSFLSLWWHYYPSDNFAENRIEDEISDLTGLKIDLSPFSPEENDRWKDK